MTKAAWLIWLGLVLTGCGGGTSTPTLVSTGSATWRLPGVSGFGLDQIATDVILAGWSTTAAPDPAKVTLSLSTFDSTFDQTPVTISTVTASQVTGTATTSAARAPLTWQVTLDILNSGAQARLTLTRDGLTGSGEGDSTAAGTPSLAFFRTMSDAAGAVVATMRSFGLLLPIAAGQGQFPGSDGTSTFGTCPAVSATRAGNALQMTFDYGAGCTSPFTAGTTVAGQVLLTGSDAPPTGQATVTFQGVALNSSPLTGTLAATFPGRRARQAALTLTLTYDQNWAVAGSFKGTGTVAATATGLFAVQQFNQTFVRPSGSAYHLEGGSLAINPVALGTYLPGQGYARVSTPDPSGGADWTATLLFDAQSPTDGRVVVQPPQGSTLRVVVGGS